MCARKFWLVVGLLMFLNFGGSGCGKKPIPAQMPLKEALDEGVIKINAHGIDLVKMSVSISCAHKTTIEIPAGTLFLSGNAADQNMMTAKSVSIAFPGSANGAGAPHTETRELEVYCVNRWLDVPQKATSFTVSKRDPADPKAKLSACLEGTKAEHGLKQFAIWLVSDNIWDMTVAQFVEREMQEVQDQFIKQIKEKEPSLSPAELEAAGHMVRERMKGQLEMRRTIRERVRPLLDQCGFDVSKKPFFQN